jgi:hypothetical protein
MPNYCDIMGWSGAVGGLGNINIDPLFYDASAGDFHLKSFGWRWDPAISGWNYDAQTSRCIDAGCPGYPITGETPVVPQIPGYGVNIRSNMGAYGGTEEASLPPYHWALLADVNNDGICDLFDFVHLSTEWMIAGDGLPCDFDRGGTIGITDLILMAQDYLKQTAWH